MLDRTNFDACGTMDSSPPTTRGRLTTRDLERSYGVADSDEEFDVLGMLFDFGGVKCHGYRNALYLSVGLGVFGVSRSFLFLKVPDTTEEGWTGDETDRF